MSKTIDVFMFIDALGWEILQRHSFLEQELPYRYSVRMQFGYSSTAIPTILSGRPPQEHKHLSFYYYAPEKSPFKIFKYLPLKYLPSRIFDRWRVRHLLSKILARYYGFTGYFEMYSMPYNWLPFLDYIEKNDIFVPRGLAPVANLADVLQQAGVPGHISNWRLSEEENIARLGALLDEGQIRFAFLYTAALDGLLHMHVREPEIIQRKLDWYAEHIRGLMARMKQHYDQFSFTVISDHGMTPLTGTVDLKGRIDALGLRYGVDYVAVYDATMARFWFLRPEGRERIFPLLEEVPGGRILSAAEKKHYGIDFADHMYGEEILLLPPGVQIAPSNMGLKALPGMHGFAPEDRDSYAACLSTAEPEIPPQWVGDYFRLMTERIDRVRSSREAKVSTEINKQR
ncbi:MAG: alkaline phosphatase family protein [Victivallales bacterium]|nr:alkaline phosphatase family protein [Victivallales bacterium]